MPVIHRRISDENLKAELTARLAGGDSTGSPIDRADFVSLHVPPETNAHAGPGCAVEPFGLECFRRKTAGVADV